MPLTIDKKKEIVEEIGKQFDENPFCLVADPVGLTVKEVSALRRRLRENGVTLKVYKNRLIRRAIEGRDGRSELEKLFSHLRGPSALAFTKGDPIAAAKIFTEYAEENEKFRIKAAICQQDYWDGGQVREMAKLGSMGAIYGRLVAAMKGPVYKLIYVLNAPGAKLTGTLKAVAEKGKK